MIQIKPTEYKNQDKEVFEGVLVYDDVFLDKKPGVMVVHTFRGQQEFETSKAIELAKLGYVAFAVDLYGKGKRAKTVEEADLLMKELNDNRQQLYNRILFSWEILKTFEQVDASKTAAIGFCFGGKSVLDLARSGAKINGVVSFHGLYDKPNLNHTGKIHASVLVLHGWEDPLSPLEKVLELKNEMNERQADWQLQTYSQTGHSFTNPLANFHDKGMFYHEKSDKRAWLSMTNFLKEIF